MTGEAEAFHGGADVDEELAAIAELQARHSRFFWLDGGGAREWSGRRSIVGWLAPEDVSLSLDAAARQVTRHAYGTSEVIAEGEAADIFTVLEAELAAGGGEDQWFGYFGYAARPDLPAQTGAGLPDAVWMRPSSIRFFDHPPGPECGSAPADWLGAEVPAEYAAGFAEVQEALHAGDSYEVNLTYRVAQSGVHIDPLAAYLSLRGRNPAPYAGFLQHDVPGAKAWLLSSSPERYALITRPDLEQYGADSRDREAPYARMGTRWLETKPIKGTTPRSDDPERDAAAIAALTHDPVYFSENLMIVDLLRNDLSMVCEPGTVAVPELMAVESYATVHQLVSTVRGRLREDVSTLAALRALFPAGSMTGAPKLRTMEIIERVETSPRGVYSGAFGWLSADGRADLGVIIRSLMTAGDGRWELGTGGGITVRSTCAQEYAESRWKAERLLGVLEEES